MLIKLSKKAQSTAEYVMLFAIVLGAVAMARSYLSKSIAGGIQSAATGLMSETNSNLYDPTLDKKNNTMESARQNNEKQHQYANLDAQHAYNEQSQANAVRTSIGGDLQEAIDEVDAFRIKDQTWDQKDTPAEDVPNGAVGQ